MTDYQKFQESRERMHEIESGTTKIATEFRQKLLTKHDEIKRDQTLSDVGRGQRLEEYKKELGKEFIAKAAEMREQFDKAAITADVAAETLLNGEAAKPSDTAVRTFERQLAEFETQLLLHTNPQSAMQNVKELIEKQSEPYFAQKIKAQLPMIIREITSLAGVEAPQYKRQLGQLIDHLDSKALTAHQRDAQDYLNAGSRYGNKIWREGSIQLSALEQAVGQNFTRHANKPSDFKPVE